MILSAVMPSLWAAKLTTMRCRSTGLGEGLDVVGADVRAAAEQGPGLAAQNQELHGPRAGAPADLVVDEVRHAGLADAGLPHQRQGIADDVVADGHFADGPLQLDDFLAGEHRLDVVGLDGGGAAGDLELFLEVRVVHEDLEHEPVLLGFGQRIGPFLLDRVLRGQHEERVGERMADAADGDLPLLHRFQQGGLRLGRRAVDFVGQDDVGEERPFEEPALARAGRAVLFQDFGAGDVGRHQVGRELHAAEREVQRTGPAC